MAQAPQDTPAHFARLQIMLIDSDPKILSLMKEVMTGLGFKKICSAHDGYEAVTLLLRDKIDLIITDWELMPVKKYPDDGRQSWGSMPPKDGEHFVKFVRTSRNSPNPYIPIIMLTGKSYKQNIEFARDSGVNEILVKPISVEGLCTRIANIVKNPRLFVMSRDYKGPCRRRRRADVPAGQQDRRKNNHVLKN